jgi:hypothetical protein
MLKLGEFLPKIKPCCELLDFLQILLAFANLEYRHQMFYLVLEG